MTTPEWRKKMLHPEESYKNCGMSTCSSNLRPALLWKSILRGRKRGMEDGKYEAEK